MRECFIFLLFIVFSIPVFARLEIYCAQSDCLSKGWKIIDTRTQALTQVICKEESCTKKGWEEVRNQTLISEVVCDEDCFKNGWTVFHGSTGRSLQTVQCLGKGGEKPDCLNWGWSVRDSHKQPLWESTCTGWDCSSRGWEMVHIQTRAMQVITCRDGSCFENGWTVSP